MRRLAMDVGVRAIFFFFAERELTGLEWSLSFCLSRHPALGSCTPRSTGARAWVESTGRVSTPRRGGKWESGGRARASEHSERVFLLSSSCSLILSLSPFFLFRPRPHAHALPPHPSTQPPPQACSSFISAHRHTQIKQKKCCPSPSPRAQRRRTPRLAVAKRWPGHLLLPPPLPPRRPLPPRPPAAPPSSRA